MTHGWEMHEDGREKMNPKNLSLFNSCHELEFNREILLNPPAPATPSALWECNRARESPGYVDNVGLGIVRKLCWP